MESKFTTVIMSMIIFLIIIILGIFGVMVFQEINGTDDSNKIEEFVSDYNGKEDNNSIQKEEIQATSSIKNKIEELEQQDNGNQTSSQTNNIESTVNTYFYNQLEKPAQIIYNALEENRENMKTGTYEIDLGTVFSDLLSTTNGENELGDYYQSAIEAYTYDNPDVFYLAPTKMYLNVETTTKLTKKTHRVYINSGKQTNYLSDEYSSKAQIDSALAQIESVKNQIVAKRIGNTYYDIKMVHDYLIDNTEYDSSISKSNIYNIYGALVNKTAVCEGYAKAFKYLMDEIGIPCIIVTGDATNSQGKTESHAWNYVQMENKWYAIDCTWDDPVIIGGGNASQESRYKYFLKGKNDFDKSHRPSGQFTEGGKMFSYPDIVY